MSGGIRISVKRHLKPVSLVVDKVNKNETTNDNLTAPGSSESGDIVLAQQLVINETIPNFLPMQRFAVCSACQGSGMIVPGVSQPKLAK